MDHPLFMESVPEKGSNDYFDALQQLIYEDPPEFVAEGFKNKGNEALKQGRRAWKDAHLFYTQGIDVNCSDNNLNSILYSNRAHVQLLRKNFRSTIEDCIKAIEFNSNNVKAHFRAAKAATELSKWDQVCRFCTRALEIVTDKTDIEDFRKMLGTAQTKIREEREAEEKKKKEKEEIQLKKMRLARAIDDRGLLFNPTSIMDHIEQVRLSNPYLDDANCLHWPVLFMYPEYGQTDFVVDMNENDELIVHVELLFEQTPDWDLRRDYQAENVDLYVVTRMTRPVVGADRYTKGNVDWHKIDPLLPLCQILKTPQLVIAKIATFFVVPRCSDFTTQLLSKPPETSL